MDSTFIETNGVKLRVVQEGPEDGPLVILLHGFPEFAYSWRRQIPYLVSKGFRVWAPDQRGYNLSDKPEEIISYTTKELAADVVGLIDAAGAEKAYLVGHDWGGSVAWRVAREYPDRLSKMVILNAPHGEVFRKEIRNNFSQLLRSWYIFFFQIPWLAEFIASLGNWGVAESILKNSSLPGTFSQRELKQYREAWSQPNAYRSMINWYRALFQNQPNAQKIASRVSVPTLLIWGANDTVLGREMAQPSIGMCDDGRLEFIEGATHWVQHEASAKVNHFLGEFLQD
jgi:epoxide hydrolase 4